MSKYEQISPNYVRSVCTDVLDWVQFHDCSLSEVRLDANSQPRKIKSGARDYAFQLANYFAGA